MKQEKIIRFKSTVKIYLKEKYNLKCNTIRDTSDWTDERWDKYKKATHVIICERENPKEKFKRKITDKTDFGCFQIISWLPEEVKR